MYYNVSKEQRKQWESQFFVTDSGWNDATRPKDQEIYDYYNYDISVPYGSIIQEIGDFTLENNIVKGRIDYKITEKWNSYYYDKPITSKVSMFNTETGVEIRIGNDNTVSGKENILNFTASERDEWTDINENVGDIKAVTIKFYVWKAATATFNPEAFAVPTETSIVAKEIGLKPCPINQHRDFNNKCVPNNKSVSDKPTVIALLGGVTALIGTLALLGSKRS